MPVTIKQNRPSLFGPDCVFYSPLSDIAGIQQEGWAIGGTPSISESPYGKCLYLNGTSDYISMYTGIPVNFTNQFTLHISLLFASLTDYVGIITKCPKHGTTGYGIHQQTSRLRAYVGNGARLETYPAGTITTNTWYRIGFVFDGSNLTIYVNGNSLGTTAIGATTITQNTDNLTIGRGIDWSLGGTVYRYFHGYMKDIILFRRNFSVAEIQGLNNQYIGL